MPIDDTSTAHEGALQRMSAMSTGDRVGQLHELDPSGGIIDGDGNELVTFVATSGAVNNLELSNNSTGKPGKLSAVGGDTDIGIHLIPKGDGVVRADRLYCYDADDTTSPSCYLAVGTGQDGMFYSTGNDVYLENRASNADLFIRALDGVTRKTFLEIDASEALLKLGNAASDITLGESGQSDVCDVYPVVNAKYNLGKSANKFHDGFFDGDVTADTVTGSSGLFTVASEYNSSAPPTATDLNSAFGSGLADGFIGILNDNGGDADVRFCIRSNGSWFISPIVLTQKV
jgi:hypothetical protein